MSSFSSTLDSQPVVYIGKTAAGRNYIGDGMKLSPNGLSVDVATGYADIQGKYHETTQTVNQVLDARSANILYATKSTYSDSPTFGAVKAALPAVDANTVALWDFSNWDGTSAIPNSAVGVNGNTIAVANNLTKSGTVSKVDGWTGYAAQGDGSTGYFTSANSTGFPVGASEREVNILYTVKNISVEQSIWDYGTSSTRFYVFQVNARLKFGDGTTNTDTGFDLEVGKTYLFSLIYDGSKILLYVNGLLVSSVAASLNTSSSVITVAINPTNSSLFAYGTIHYIELRNKMRTPAQIAAISNKLCLPCSYTDIVGGAYPTVASADISTYHEWKLGETSGSIVADTQGTSPINGTATGTTIVNSDIISGAKARNLNGTSDYIELSGKVTGTGDFTLIVVFKNTNPSQSNKPLLSNGGWGSQINAGIALSFQGGSVIRWGEFVASSTVYQTDISIGYGARNFLAAVSPSASSSLTTFYVDSPTPTTTWARPSASRVSPTYNLTIGKETGNSNLCAANIDYLIYIPRTLSQNEIAQYYKVLMNTANTQDIRSILPTDSISLGFARTNSSTVVEIDDSSYKYGRREGATGGNRRVFLGWKYFSGVTDLYWNNPFGTRKIKTYYTWAQDANGTNEIDVTPFAQYSTSIYGIQSLNSASYRIKIRTMSDGVGWLNTTPQTSGYIGCYCELAGGDN